MRNDFEDYDVDLDDIDPDDVDDIEDNYDDFYDDKEYEDDDEEINASGYKSNRYSYDDDDRPSIFEDAFKPQSYHQFLKENPQFDPLKNSNDESLDFDDSDIDDSFDPFKW